MILECRNPCPEFGGKWWVWRFDRGRSFTGFVKTEIVTTSHSLPRPAAACRGLPRPAAACRGLPRPAAACRGNAPFDNPPLKARAPAELDRVRISGTSLASSLLTHHDDQAEKLCLPRGIASWLSRRPAVHPGERGGCREPELWNSITVRWDPTSRARRGRSRRQQMPQLPRASVQHRLGRC